VDRSVVRELVRLGLVFFSSLSLAADIYRTACFVLEMFGYGRHRMPRYKPIVPLPDGTHASGCEKKDLGSKGWRVHGWVEELSQAGNVFLSRRYARGH
jgi:hypothetical protein